MKESEIYDRVRAVADKLKADNVYNKYSDCFTAAIEICSMFIECNSLHKPIPYDSDGFLKNEQNM